MAKVEIISFERLSPMLQWRLTRLVEGEFRDTRHDVVPDDGWANEANKGTTAQEYREWFAALSELNEQLQAVKAAAKVPRT